MVTCQAYVAARSRAWPPRERNLNRATSYTPGAEMIDPLLDLALGLPVLVLLISVLVFVGTRREAPLLRARRQAIAALCAQRGLLPGAVNQPGEAAMPNQINFRAVANPFSSPDGRVGAGEFASGNGKHMQLFSMLAFTVDGVNVPYIAVRPREVMGPTVGGPPTVELESTEFDQRFTVRSEDRRSAVMMFDQGMMQWLLDCQFVSFEMIGARVVAYVNRATVPSVVSPQDPRRVEPVEFELLLKFWDGFVPRVPAIVRSEYATAH
jgi:hypothetical protein